MLNKITTFFRKFFKCWEEKPLRYRNRSNTLSGIELLKSYEEEDKKYKLLLGNVKLDPDNNGFVDIPLD